MAIYYIVTSSKGIVSVVLAHWIAVSQKTSWKMGHAIRAMMANNDNIEHMLNGIVEVNETYIGGKLQPDKDHPHKRGKGTDKQLVFVATERHGKECSSLIRSVGIVKEVMEKAKTFTGLKVFTSILDKFFKTGRKVDDDFKENMRINFDEFLPQWNYVDIPSNQVIVSLFI